MWDWYNRPGGIRRVPTWKLVVVIVTLAVISSVVLWVLYVVLAAVLFRPLPR